MTEVMETALQELQELREQLREWVECSGLREWAESPDSQETEVTTDAQTGQTTP
jgi:hypothetical protein